MKPSVPRMIFHAVAAWSLVLLLATGTLWLRSLRQFDDVVRAKGRSCINLVSVGGQLYLQVCGTSTDQFDTGWDWTSAERRNVGYHPGPIHWRFAGFEKGYGESRRATYTIWEHVFVVPYWFLALLFSVTPSLWLRAARHRRAARRWGRDVLCAHCGYDLRATPGRCPECGAERGKPEKGKP